MKSYIHLYLLCTLIALCSPAVSASELDDFISKYNDTYPTTLGPNCYGTGLAATTSMTYSGYISAEEFQYLVNSPLCSEKKGPLVKGDLIAIKTTSMKKGILLSQFNHLAVYISKSLFFEKSNYSLNDSAKIINESQSLAPYSGFTLHEIRASADFARENIGTWALAYNCKSLISYLKENHNDWFQKNKRFFRKFNLEEERLLKWTQEKNTFYDALRATSSRLLSYESTIMQSIVSRNSNLLKKNEIKEKESTWSELPMWVSLVMIKRLQVMNKQVQFLIATKVLEENGKL